MDPEILIYDEPFVTLSGPDSLGSHIAADRRLNGRVGITSASWFARCAG